MGGKDFTELVPRNVHAFWAPPLQRCTWSPSPILCHHLSSEEGLCVCVEVKEGQEDMGHFSRSSLGPGVKGHEKGTIISLRHFLSRIPPGLSTAIPPSASFRSTHKILLLDSSTNEKYLSGWAKGTVPYFTDNQKL